jgi:CheY-like chemotaxis protein
MSNTSFFIVLVEDNPADAYLFKKALEEAGVSSQIDVLEDGEEALNYLSKANPDSPVPDLFVLDLNLPKAEGLQVLAALRTSAMFATIPAIIATSSSAPGEQARAEKLGIERFLTKPLSLDGFLQLGHVVRDILVKNRV